MQNVNLTLDDLCPEEAQLIVSGAPEQVIMICKWSLRVRKWALAKYGGVQGLQDIFNEKRIGDIAELAYFMLKDKTQFKTLDDFLDTIVTPKDQLNLMTALLKTVGIGEPQMKEIQKAMESADPNV